MLACLLSELVLRELLLWKELIVWKTLKGFKILKSHFCCKCFCFGIVLKTDFENNHKCSGFLLELLLVPLHPLLFACLVSILNFLVLVKMWTQGLPLSFFVYNIFLLNKVIWLRSSKRTWLTFRTCVDSYSSCTVALSNSWIFLWVAPGRDDLKPGPSRPHLGPYPCVPRGWFLVSVVYFLNYLGLAAQIALRLLISNLWRAVLFTIWISFPIFVFRPFNVVLKTTKCNFFQIKINTLKKASLQN